MNGFYGAKGPAGGVPAAYVYIAKQFYNQVLQQGQHSRIHLQEYFRNKWTFHVKGLWYYFNDQTLPSLTLVGSPNFGNVLSNEICYTTFIAVNYSFFHIVYTKIISNCRPWNWYLVLPKSKQMVLFYKLQ